MSTKRSLFLALAALLVMVVPPSIVLVILATLEPATGWEVGFARLGFFAWFVIACLGLGVLLMLVSFAFGLREVRSNRLVLIWVIPQMLALLAAVSAGIAAGIAVPLMEAFGLAEGANMDGIIGGSGVAVVAISLMATGVWVRRLVAVRRNTSRMDTPPVGNP